MSIFDKVVVVAVIKNPSKSPMFTSEERVADAARTSSSDDTECRSRRPSKGCSSTSRKERGIDVIVKGLRAVSDFDYELQMAQMNHNLADIDTVFIPTSPEYGYLSSSLVKDVGRLGGSVEGLVPGDVGRMLKERWSE